MKKTVLAIFILLISSNILYCQGEMNKLTKGLVLGYLNDTLFEGLNEKTLILLDKGTNHLSITLFKEGLTVKNPDVQDFFNDLIGDIIVEFTFNPESLENNMDGLEDVVYQSVVFATINGVQKEVLCSYTAHSIRTNNQTYNNVKLNLNIVIKREDFNLNTELGISKVLEIEITDGPINVY